MKTISGLGIGLSLVFLLLALVAEVYYLLRWKKHKKRVTSQESEEEKEEEQPNGYAKELIQLFCFKKPQSLQQNNGGREGEISMNQDVNPDLELGLMKHLNGGDLGFEAELMKLHNQRFLFTIMEETKADLESDDGSKSRLGSRSRRRSLSDVPNDCNTPGFTPLASPTTLKSSPLESYPHHGFNPLFESDGELEFNKFFRSSSSPPPKFKFMRDAEEKLRKRMIEEARRREGLASVVTQGSFLKFMNPAMNREKKQSIQESDETVSFSPSSSSGTTNLRTLVVV
ncbi:unnamed protein product [Arabidopsis lyrata]|uniref:Transmembrane protein n=1 Tax=Arabidopsis lyrata subsp. lyrata TaxID=81972 RepID=D7MSE0_ARALL|nr:uncharacterized protein LOC9302402 [Arabidopsis lyrata subsp. lyrata]EFH40887.1 hypothetical protein ARALYDRAFT_496062 [Arabidopsis lyrata subsp. lyrata]CAH8280221.1 unnamed protein product [Arabidopsis lyrata]|eukprot:XP_020871648.1 uncharacterized protein LOC9302402 [Arabidopsis lyrata subsp. lyrata]